MNDSAAAATAGADPAGEAAPVEPRSTLPGPWSAAAAYAGALMGVGVVVAPPPTAVALRCAIAVLATVAVLVSTVLLARRAQLGAWIAVLLQIAPLTVLGLELLFMMHPQSTGLALSLSQQRWQTLYWHPLNHSGYRDREHSEAELASHRLLVVVGDSFAAGYGIRDASDRFADRLATTLPSDWSLVNLALSGLDTRAEFGELRRFGHRPAIVVLSYFVNDIEQAARDAGMRPRPSPPLPPLARWLQPFSSRSYLADYLFHTRATAGVRGRVEDFFRAAYRNPDALAKHADDLLRMARWCERHDSRLVVLAFPHLVDLDGSRDVIAWLERTFERQAVPVLDVSPLVASLRPRERIVSWVDPHPSVETHRRVALALEKWLTEIEPSLGEPKSTTAG